MHRSLWGYWTHTRKVFRRKSTVFDKQDTQEENNDTEGMTDVINAVLKVWEIGIN